MTVPIGTILPFAGTAAPAEYLLCYGQAISRSEYSELFSLISTTYGSGNGTTTFNIPDLRGRVAAGQDDMGGTSANRLTGQSGGVDGDTLGAAGGAETHTLIVAELAAHTHAGTTDSGGAHTHTYQIGTNDVPGFTPIADLAETASQTGTTDSGGAHTHTFTTNSTGGDDPHNNMQPTLILNYIIRTGAESNFYVAENGTDFYVTEDGADNYVTEN